MSGDTIPGAKAAGLAMGPGFRRMTLSRLSNLRTRPQIIESAAASGSPRTAAVSAACPHPSLPRKRGRVREGAGGTPAVQQAVALVVDSERHRMRYPIATAAAVAA